MGPAWPQPHTQIDVHALGMNTLQCCHQSSLLTLSYRHTSRPSPCIPQKPIMPLNSPHLICFPSTLRERSTCNKEDKNDHGVGHVLHIPNGKSPAPAEFGISLPAFCFCLYHQEKNPMNHCRIGHSKELGLQDNRQVSKG